MDKLDHIGLGQTKQTFPLTCEIVSGVATVGIDLCKGKAVGQTQLRTQLRHFFNQQIGLGNIYVLSALV